MKDLNVTVNPLQGIICSKAHFAGGRAGAVPPLWAVVSVCCWCTEGAHCDAALEPHCYSNSVACRA